MKIIEGLSLFLFTILCFWGCSTSQNMTSTTEGLFEIDNTPYSREEFIYVYKKNNYNTDSIYSEKSVNDYLDLFINFKLKVTEAESLGLDTTDSFKSEFESYRGQLAESYLSKNQVTEELISQAYERMQQEVSVSHILARVNEEASPEDTVSAYRLISEIRDKAINGEHFNKLVLASKGENKDKVVAENLGYFTVFQMVYPFENMAYNTTIGEISKIVRTRFGYHILNVHDIRAARGDIQVSHILLRLPKELSREDSIKKRKTIFEIHQRLLSGADWAETCSQFSEDMNTRNNGGTLPEFSSTARNIHPGFANECYLLQDPGEISDPFLTPFGWHIIRLEKRTGIKPINEVKTMLKSRVMRDSRSQIGKKRLINKLKEENNLVEYKEIYTQAQESIVNKRVLDLEDSIKIMFTIDNLSYTIGDFYAFQIQNKSIGSDTTVARISKGYNRFLEDRLLEYEKAHLAEKYYDYKMLKQEYREGILLFQLMEQKVWNKAASDSIGIRSYFNENREEYHQNSKANTIIISSGSIEIHEKIGQVLLNIDTMKLNDVTLINELKSDMENEYNNESNLNLQVTREWYEQNSNPLLEDITWQKGKYSKLANGRFHWIIIIDVVPRKQSELEDVKGLVISDYQRLLEEKWVKELKAKYSVEVNNSKLRDVYTELEIN